jgi:hypothetical protein
LSDRRLFPSLKQNLLGPDLKNDCELETVVTRWQLLQMTGFRQQRTDDMTSFKLWWETMWKSYEMKSEPNTLCKSCSERPSDILNHFTHFHKM